MKVKDGYILKKVMGSYMIVYTGDGDAVCDNMRTLNETGAFLWSLLQNHITKEEMVERLAAEYEVDSLVAIKDIDAFISKLYNANLIEE